MLLIQYASGEKRRGGFYTPEPIANFILKWAVNGNQDYDVLEPSCGDGVFLEQIKKSRFKYHSVTAIEIIPEEAEKSKAIQLPNTKILTQDFFQFCNTSNERFDLVVGNPPYIRYQYFDKEQRKEAERIFVKAGLKYSKLTNTWVSFVVGASLLLKERGKIAFVLPAEILQVSYAKQLRNFLARFYNKINIVSFRKLVFPEVQQEIVLLLCEKNGNGTHLIEHLELEDASKLDALDVTRLKSPKKKIDFKSNKWTFYFLDQQEIDFIEKLLHQKLILPLGNYAKVEVGMTTGSNEFFTVPKDIVEKYSLSHYAKPMVGRSVQVPSSIFTKQDWRANTKTNARAYFLLLPLLRELQGKKNALKYLEEGEARGFDKMYKCGIRNEWHIVPSAWISEALFIRRNNIYPKFILNKAKAYTTDTMHRVTINKIQNVLTGKRINSKALVASYYNSMSFAFAEISGRSHGGGVLELMPNEVENILLPYDERNASLLGKIDKMLRSGKNIDEVLAITDKIILNKHAGFSNEDIETANKIWKKLLKRRLERN